MTTYKYIDDEIVLKRNIDNLEQLAKDELLKKGEKIELEIQDMYFWAALDKTIKMLDSYLYAYDRKNITVLAALTRMEIEIVARVYGITLVENQTKFCEDIIINKRAALLKIRLSLTAFLVSSLFIDSKKQKRD